MSDPSFCESSLNTSETPSPKDAQVVGGRAILRVASSEREGAILVCDDSHNDVADFFHNEHATVSQSFDTALGYANALVKAVNSHEANEAKIAAAVKALEITLAMIKGEAIASAVVELKTMWSLGDVVSTTLSSLKEGK